MKALYRCLTARPDALFELTDAILCSDHAVTGSTSSWPPSGTLRTAWAALVDVERTAAATLTRQAIRQVTNLHKTMWMWHARPSRCPWM